MQTNLMQINRYFNLIDLYDTISNTLAKFLVNRGNTMPPYFASLMSQQSEGERKVAATHKYLATLLAPKSARE